MSADYFQDIAFPGDDKRKGPPDDREERSPHEESDGAIDVPIRVGGSARGIRNIAPVRPRRDMRPRPAPFDSELHLRAHRRSSSRFLWLAAILTLATLASIGLLALRTTAVTVTPKHRALSFDGSAALTALPADSAAASALTYTVKTLELDDSEVVPAGGVARVETKASGSITVHNDTPGAVKLVRSTRFAAPPGGLIFRAPADIAIGARKSVRVTVVADKAGEQYNIGPASRLSLPGLKSNPALYAGVYGTLEQAMSGGFSGDRPAAAPGALASALSAIRGRIEEKARASAAAGEGMAFPNLIHIAYQDQPNTPEAGGGVRLHEHARIEIPVIPRDRLAAAVAASSGLDGNPAGVELRPGKGFAARPVSPDGALGSAPLSFTLEGSADLVWKIDASALAEALAGKDQSAFQTIVNGFAGIQEARARIEPFWRKTFPDHASDITIMIEDPARGA